jgi:LDH2 family malate/lactate/ureidoglycolate dehydrogenase
MWERVRIVYGTVVNSVLKQAIALDVSGQMRTSGLIIRVIVVTNLTKMDSHGINMIHLTKRTKKKTKRMKNRKKMKRMYHLVQNKVKYTGIFVH